MNQVSEEGDQVNPDYESDASDCDMQDVSDKSENVQEQKQEVIPVIELSDDDDERDVVMKESVIELSGGSSSEDECTSRVASPTRACKRSRTESTGYGAERSPSPVDNRDLVHVIDSRSAYSHHFRTTMRYITFKFRPPRGPTTGIDWFDKCLKELVRLIREGHDLDEIIGMTIASDLFLRGPGWFQVRPLRNFNYADLWRIFGIIAQSNKAFREINDKDIYLVKDGFRLIVFRLAGIRAGPQEKPIYNGRDEFQSAVPPLRYKETIILALDEERAHYEPVINFLGVARFIQRHPTHRFACVLCNRSYKASSSHQCSEKCEACISFNPCEPALYDVPCNDCNRVFVSQKCFDNHKRRGSYYNNSKNAIATVCDKIRICVDCYKQYDSMFDKHECGVSYCVDCRSRHNPNDQCYIRVKAPVRVRDPNASDYHPENQFICFDIESEQDEKFKDNPDPNKIQYEHVVCLLVAQLVCDFCRGNEDLTQSYPYCGAREIPYKKRDNPVRKFLKLILHHPKKGFTRRIVFAHCAGRYDVHFLLKKLNENFIIQGSGVTPHVIMNGLQIKSLHIGNVVILDAHSFLTMELRAFPKAFGLADTKGFFPHKFNTKNNATYNDKWPAKKFYDPDNMSVSERAEFEEWYPTVCHGTFNLQAELLKFCKQDVTVLRQAILKFRDMFIEMTNVCPFTGPVTLAGACTAAFMTTFMEDKVIGVIPARGYVRADKQSQKAIEYFTYLEEVHRVEIQHAGKGRERVLFDNIRVDGYIPSPPEVVIQFHGCLYHGCEFPIGHPRIYQGSACLELTGEFFENFDRVNGMVMALVLPPDNLFHPLLPRKEHDKLMFVLCRECCETLTQTECTHTTNESRALYGTWTAIELKAAIARGYRILRVDVIWQYRMTKYDSEAAVQDETTKGLFVDFIDVFYKMKTLASGFPAWCVDDESKERYIREFYEHEGIQLEREKIQKNPGLRSTAKLGVNSLWGRFGMRSNMIRTEVITDPGKFFRLLNDPDKEGGRIEIMSEKVLYAWWKDKDHAVRSASNTNVVIASYVTAQARLKLYEYLEKLDKRVLYYDTDSIFATVSPSDDYVPPCGEYLGDWKNELEEYGPGAGIHTFVSGGPKCYAYRGKNDANETFEQCKVKGISLNYKNSQMINFESLRKLVESHYFRNEGDELPERELPTVDDDEELEPGEYFIQNTSSGGGGGECHSFSGRGRLLSEPALAEFISGRGLRDGIGVDVLCLALLLLFRITVSSELS
ncbi:hypothetical protein QAD02_004018 [Eretmocerus hayati]|uniref:Uncharacterized protein n=1 Tax=Eretmocerus hayati TaxID=131215 RepID=A0ACC2NNK2_9HYME|nr:hypothetical protein QAD02_004018 [Eretmocerus hayati]